MDPDEREETIEKLVGRLKEALMAEVQGINAADGMSAALIFTSRLARALIMCSHDNTSRVTNTQMICEALRELADDLEESEEGKPMMIVH